MTDAAFFHAEILANDTPTHNTSALPPPVNVEHLWLSPRTPHDTPHHIFVSLVNLLMLRKRRYQREVPRSQNLLLLPTLTNDRTVSTEREDNGILIAMVVNSG